MSCILRFMRETLRLGRNFVAQFKDASREKMNHLSFFVRDYSLPEQPLGCLDSTSPSAHKTVRSLSESFHSFGRSFAKDMARRLMSYPPDNLG